MHRRGIAVPGLLAVALAGAAACGSPQSSNTNTSQSATIKIGLIRPVTGTVAASGKDMDDGWNLYWAQHGTTVAGKKVVTLAQDDTGTPRSRSTRRSS